MKKILSILALLMVITTAAKADDVVWTEVSTADELKTAVNANANIKLTQDIDVSGLSATTNGYLFGTFTGQITGENANGADYMLRNSGHPLFYNLVGAKLSHLIIENIVVSNVTSVIARTSSGSTFTNITMIGCSLTNDDDDDYNTGLMSGYSDSDTFEYCAVNAQCSINCDNKNAGGLVGRANANDTFKYCHNAGTVTSENTNVGGIVGFTNSGTVIEKCLNTGTVKGYETFGGIAGNTTSSTITKCENTGYLDYFISWDGYCGGIVGKSNGCTISYNLSFGNMNLNTDNDGPIVDEKDNTTLNYNIYYCYSDGYLEENLSDFSTSYDDLFSGWFAFNKHLSSDDYFLRQDLDDYFFTATNLPVPITAVGLLKKDLQCDGTLTYSNKYQSFNSHTAKDGGYGICSTCGKVLSESVKDTITISDASGLNAFSYAVNKGVDYSKATVVLSNDINMSSVTYFTPIGTSSNPFKGTFDGQGHRIKNLTIDASRDGVGLFGFVAGTNSVIKNVIIDSSCSITSTSGYGTAGVVGEVRLDGSTIAVTIQNCGNEAVITGCINTAGILGCVYSGSNAQVNIYNCYNTGTIRGYKESAAICGYTYQNYNIANCYNTGTLWGLDGTNCFYRTHSSGTHNVENCYDVNGSQDGVEQITSNQVASGYLCYYLNKNRGSYAAWEQNLGSDTHPTFGTSGITYSRSTSGQWNSIVLPFDVAISDSDPYVFYQPIGVVENSLLLKKISTSKLAAGTPALICMKEAAIDSNGNYTLSLSCQGDISTTITNQYVINNLTFTGVYTSTDLTSVGGYIFKDGELINITSVQDANCNPYYAYLAGTVSGSPQQLTLVADTFKISTFSELEKFANMVKSGIEFNACLTNDIDMDPDFLPIGTSDSPFKGTFDGQGYHIKSLLMLNPTIETGIGLFGVVAGENTVIKNVIIDSEGLISSASSTAKGIAGLVGYVDSNGDKCNVTIQNCGNETTVGAQAYNCVAGILGGVSANDNTQITIENCYNNAIIISGTYNIDGEFIDTCASICGYAGNNFTIANCYNNGTVPYTTDGYHLYRYNTSSSSSNQSVSNCYDTNCSQTGVTLINASQVTSGELCQKLNAGSTVFEQELETETYPIPGTAGLHYARTMANQWGTICLPYATEAGEEYDLYELSNVSDDALTLTKVEGTLPAGTPAIVHRNTSATGIDVSPVSGSDFVNTPVTGSSANGLTLKGAFSSTNITDKDGYIIANNAFWNIADIKGENKVYCAPFRAWLAGTIASGAKRLTIGFDDDIPTAVETLNAITSGTAQYYDLNGRKLNGLQPGVNIVKFNNGTIKKVIIK